MRIGWTDGSWTERWYNNGICKDRSSKGRWGHRHDCWRADVRSTGGQRERRRFKTLAAAKAWVYKITGKWPGTGKRPKTFSEIQEANRARPIASGWRGQRCMGGGAKVVA